jgi:hypothetical protein
MSRNRLLHIWIIIAVVIVIPLTAREAAARAAIVSQTDSIKGAKALECTSLPSRYSIRMEDVKELGMGLSYTEDGPTGVDGGLIYLLSSYPAYSR